MGANWYVTVRRHKEAAEYLPLAGPFTAAVDALDAMPRCIKYALDIDNQADTYHYGIEKLAAPKHLRFRGVFTPRGNLFTPWFRGLIP